MSQTTTQARPSVSDPFAGGMQLDEEAFEPRMMPVVADQGRSADQATAQLITAQRVAVKRKLPDILREVKALAHGAGPKFYYSIPFKERGKNGAPDRTVHVEGPSIDCAMAALNSYGNCRVEAFPVKETATHWTFMAQFVDYEKGVTVMRAFNQRKSQTTGMRDAERNLDIIFQIGQSKAIRNVILAGLKWLTDEMFAAAKSGVVDRIAKNPDATRQWLAKQLDDIGVALSRVERIVGRTLAHWLAGDMAKLFAELQSVRDGFADADDLWPTAEADALRREEESQPAGTRGQAEPTGPGHDASLQKDADFLSQQSDPAPSTSGKGKRAPRQAAPADAAPAASGPPATTPGTTPGTTPATTALDRAEQSLREAQAEDSAAAPAETRVQEDLPQQRQQQPQQVQQPPPDPDVGEDAELEFH